MERYRHQRRQARSVDPRSLEPCSDSIPHNFAAIEVQTRRSPRQCCKMHGAYHLHATKTATAEVAEEIM